MAISMDLSQESYTITGGEQGKRRLNLLAEIFQPTTLRLLQDAGLRRGDRCLDLGCGGGHVVLDMARMVGPGGFVNGIALAAGLGDIHWNVFQPIHTSGPHKHMTAVTMEKIRPAVLRHGLATNQGIDSILTRVYFFVQDPATLAALPRIVQVWGTA